MRHLSVYVLSRTLLVPESDTRVFLFDMAVYLVENTSILAQVSPETTCAFHGGRTEQQSLRGGRY